MKYDWCTIGEPTADPDIWHAVDDHRRTADDKQGRAKTVCGQPNPNPDEEWCYVAQLGHRRPCDNCTKIIAERADAPA